MKQLTEHLSSNTKNILFGGLWLEPATMDFFRSKYSDIEILTAVERVILWPRRNDDLTALFGALRKSQDWQDKYDPIENRRRLEHKLYCLDMFETHQCSLDSDVVKEFKKNHEPTPLSVRLAGLNLGPQQKTA